jgi:dephospho-CoA kinase
MPLVIALTGGIGSGKSSVADHLATLGAAVVDTDAIAHRLTAAGGTGAAKIGEQFGADYLCDDGSLDRPRMRDLVFSDPNARKKLESILHPMIRAAVETAVQAASGPYIVLVVPLLVETGAYRDFIDRVLVVDCDESEQIVRVSQRSHLPGETVRKIMATQVSRVERLARADDVIVNDADITTLHSRTLAVHQRYLDLARGVGAAQTRAETHKNPH